RGGAGGHVADAAARTQAARTGEGRGERRQPPGLRRGPSAAGSVAPLVPTFPERGRGTRCCAAATWVPRDYPNTSSATSTRPNGALTCTPCTLLFTCSHISRAIFTPSASAASFPFSCA